LKEDGELIWEIKENFLAMNGWNHNQGDKNTEYKFFVILRSEVDQEIGLEEISTQFLDLEDFMDIQGLVTNPLVNYFKDKDDSLNKCEALHNRKPALNIFEIDKDSLETSNVKCWPDEIQ
jgi:hypothetical protein